MTEGPIQVLDAEGKGDTSNDLVQFDESGDPLPDPKAVRMIEVESLERVIDGMKISAEACAHLARTEPESADYWIKLKFMLDTVRKMATQHAGLAHIVNETKEVEKDPLAWKDARSRFKEGIKQAGGGMRQIATCFRSDVVWSQMATTLENMLQKMNRDSAAKFAMARRNGLLWMPGDE